MRLKFSFSTLLGLLALMILPVQAKSAVDLQNGSLTVVPNNTGVDAGYNSNVTAVNNEVVTFGIPFADCLLFDSNNFRLYDENDNEVAVYVEVTLEWPDTRLPCTTTSIRALKVQFQFDAVGVTAPLTYDWEIDNGARGTIDILEMTISESVSDDAAKGGFKEPNVFVIHDPNYVVNTGLIPPTLPADGSTDYDRSDGYYFRKWGLDARDFDFTTSTGGNWLFDRTSTAYRQAMRRGEVEHYRQAYLHHEFYIDKIEITGANTNVVDYCLGGFDYDGKADSFSDDGAGCDSKYVYSHPILLHLALTGDDSWEPSENGTPSSSGAVDTRDEVWFTIADLLFTGSTRCPLEAACQSPAVPTPGFSQPYSNIADGYTERKPGLGFQAILGSCQLTLDTTVCGWLDTIVNNMHDHLTSNPDGRGNVGYLSHSWDKHENGFLPWLGEIETNATNSTNIVVGKTIVDGPGKLVADNMVRINGVHHAIAGVPTENGDGTWNLTLVSPITVSAGDQVLGSFQDVNNQNTALLLHDQDVDRVFSPWMQSLIADGLWEYYHWTENATQKQKVEDLLLGFGQAYAAYAVDATRMTTSTKTLVENAFGVSIFDSQLTSTVGCGMTEAPYTRYVASDLMATSADITRDFMLYMFQTGAFSDQHTPEGIFQLSLGVFFETDPAKKAAMKALVDDALEWFEKYSCTGTVGPPRSFSWQNKPDPFGTYLYISSFSLSYDDGKFVEAVANDGSVTETLELTIGGTEFADKAYVAGVDFAVTNLPAGFTGATLTRTSATTANLALTGNADSHLPANSVTNLTFELMDSAIVDFDANRIDNYLKADLEIEFINPQISYDGTSFSESTNNDGSVATSVIIDLVGDTFTTAAGAFPGTSFSVTGLPSGLSASLSANSNIQAVLTFTGNADDHSNTSDTSSINFAFEDGAFTTTGTAASVINFSNTFSLDFIEPALSYDGTIFNEDSSSNNGTIVNSLTVTLSEDTFVVSDGLMTENTHFTVSNLPANLTVAVTGTTSTTATISLTGSATNHANADEISNLTIDFLPAAFTTTTDVSNMADASKMLSLAFVEPALNFAGSAFNEDSSLNNGTLLGSSIITLSDDTFVTGPFVLNTHFTVSNVPTGLTPVLSRDNATMATLTFSGAAINHGNANELSNLGLTLLPAAFTNSNSTANIVNASKTDFSIGFVEPGISYGTAIFNEDPAANDGSFTDTLTLTLSDDTFVNPGGSLTDTVHFTTTGLPAGLTVGIDINGAGTVATVSLSGMAASHLDADDVNNFTLNFLDAAFSTSPAASILDAMKMDIVINFFQDGLSYDTNTLVETNNTGSISDVLNLTLVGETFLVTAAAMTENTEYTVANVPSGMTAVITGTSANTATLALTGIADNRTAADDVTDLTVTFLDAAFFGDDAASVPGSSRNDLIVDFRDGLLSFSGSVFNESTSNDASISNVLDLTLQEDTFVVPGGAMVAGNHYNVSNVPAGLTAVVTGTSASTATFALIGNAGSGTNSDDVSDLTLTFLDAAFGGGAASHVVGSSKADIVVDFIDSALNYSGSTFTEAGANNGTVATVVTLTLTSDTFALGGAMTAGVHFIASNVPAGLAVAITGTGATTATVVLTGAAASHANVDDIANLGIQFLDAAFTGGNAAGITNSVRSDLVVDFIDPSSGTGGGGGSSGSGDSGSGGSTGGSSSGGSTGSPSNIVGEVDGLTVNAGQQITNQGVLSNLTNSGIVNGGSVKGTVNNSATGVLNNVSLQTGTTVIGGSLVGDLQGTGTVKDAIVDASTLSSGISLGSGVRVTANTVRNVTGLNLTEVIKDDTGKINLKKPLVINDDMSESTLLDLTLEPVNALFGNEETLISDDDDDGNAILTNSELGSSLVLVTPGNIETTTDPDGVSFSDAGDLVITNDGIKVTMQPSPYNSESFASLIDAFGATSDQLSDGLVFVGIDEVTFSFQFSYVATPPVNNPAIQALNGNEVTVMEIGSFMDRENYRFMLIFPDGFSQELVPSLHDIAAFSSAMAIKNRTYEIDVLTGIIKISNENQVIFRGIPDYELLPPANAGTGVDLDHPIDVNQDGIPDIYLVTDVARQVIYGLPVQ